MKKTTTILILLLANFGFIQAQTIQYTYDVNGNQTARVHNSSTTTTDESGANPDQLLAAVISIIDQNLTEEENLENEKKKEASLKISVYPNPATDKITVTKMESEITEEPSDAQAFIFLINSQGKILDQINANNQTITIDIQHLAKSVYYVYYKSNDHQMAWQVVKE